MSAIVKFAKFQEHKLEQLKRARRGRAEEEEDDEGGGGAGWGRAERGEFAFSNVHHAATTTTTTTTTSLVTPPQRDAVRQPWSAARVPEKKRKRKLDLDVVDLTDSAPVTPPPPVTEAVARRAPVQFGARAADR
jgi:hypothetical protein